jgi:eukaryotic-like serine/threonine-protein kinase
MPDPTERIQSALGPGYTFLRELGGGGMSRVLVLRDERLGREVVVKQLPADAGAAVSAERFDREIALAARLQHPHIVPVLGAGRTDDGLPYYTMPFVEGESLRARLSRVGELPVGQAVTILREVARALQYAHERGIVHRDIKPDNILLSGGAALVTDFGVAKAITASTNGESPAAMTQLGVALGTPAYMAPEQAAAEQTVDQRADIYAFGCVAYEILAGAPPFSGRNASALLAAQVSEQPEPLDRRRPATPPDLAALVMACLEKRPSDRPQTAAELLTQLDRISLTPPGTAARSASARTPARRGARLLPWVVVAAMGGVALILALRPRESTAKVRAVRFELDQSQVPVVGRGVTIALSPLGEALVYRGPAGRGTALYWRGYEQASPRMIPGTEEAAWPQFSADGSSLYFFVGNRLKRMPVAGGTVSDLGEMPVVGVMAFLPDGRVVHGSNRAGLVAIRPDGAHDVLTHPDSARNETWHTGPMAFDGGRQIAYLAGVRSQVTGRGADVAVLDIASGVSRPLTVQAIRVVGVRQGFLITLSGEGQLVATPFDERRGTVTGPSTPMIDGIADNTAILGADGTLAYATAVPQRIVRRDLTGRVRQTLYSAPPRFMMPDLRVSRDGRRALIAPMEPGRVRNIYVLDVATGALARATDGVDEWTAVFTPNGREIVYTSRRDGPRGIYRQPLDGSTPPSLVTSFDGSFWSVTPDAEFALYSIRGDGTAADVWMAPLRGGQPRPLLNGKSSEQQPMVSPDGTLLAYVSDETGRAEVYVRRYPSLTERVLVSTSGGSLPRWSSDTRQLFFRGGGAQRVARLEVRGELRVSRIDSLFPADDPGMSLAFGNYDVDADGRHFLESMSADVQSKMMIVLNWTQQLAQLKR